MLGFWERKQIINVYLKIDEMIISKIDENPTWDGDRFGDEKRQSSSQKWDIV